MLRAASWLYRQRTASDITATVDKVVTGIYVSGRAVWRNDDELYSYFTTLDAEPESAAEG